MISLFPAFGENNSSKSTAVALLHRAADVRGAVGDGVHFLRDLALRRLVLALRLAAEHEVGKRLQEAVQIEVAVDDLRLADVFIGRLEVKTDRLQLF